MAISTRLSRKLRESLGDEGANDLVDWMVQVEDRRSELHGIVEASRVATDARFAEFGARMDLRFAEQREANARLETLFERRFGDLIKWSFVFWCGAVAAIAMLARSLS
jgi:hypothetical protein